MRVSDTTEERKQAEIDYPSAVGEEGRAWIRTKPFGNTPRESARLLIDFGYVLQLLDLRAGIEGIAAPAASDDRRMARRTRDAGDP